MINYQILNSLAATIPNPASDCVDVILVNAAKYAGAFCSDAFDQVVTYSQSAASPSATVAGGAFATPPPCLQATSSVCPAACQKDIALLESACHAEVRSLQT